jgi:hypothetical protein
MKQHILKNFSDEDKEKILVECLRLSDQLEISEKEVGFDGTIAALAGLVFAELMTTIVKGNTKLVTDFFDDLENGFDSIGMIFEYNLELIKSREVK